MVLSVMERVDVVGDCRCDEEDDAKDTSCESCSAVCMAMGGTPLGTRDVAAVGVSLGVASGEEEDPVDRLAECAECADCAKEDERDVGRIKCRECTDDGGDSRRVGVAVPFVVAWVWV